MGVIKSLLVSEIAYRERLTKRQTARKGQLYVAAWLTLVMFIRLLVNDIDCARQIRIGSPGVGLALFQFSILHTVAVIFLFTFSVYALSLESILTDRTRVLCSPLPRWKLAVANLLSCFFNSIGLNNLAFAIPAFIPLLFLKNPISAIIALASIIVSAYLLAILLAVTISRLPGATQVAGLFKVIFLIVMIAMVFANPSYRFGSDHASVILFGSTTVKLFDIGARVAIPLGGRLSPTSWVIQATTFQESPRWTILCAALATILALATIFTTIFDVRASSHHPTRARRGRSPFSIENHSAMASMLIKELRYLELTNKHIQTFTISILFTALCFTSEGALIVPLLGALLIVAVSSSYAFNVFGHDGAALLRYAMRAPDWGDIMRTRDAAYGILVGLSVLPLLIATFIRFGFVAALSFFTAVSVVVISVVLVGNIISIALPVATKFPIDSTRGEPLLNQILPLLIWAIPLAIHSYAAPFGTAGFVAVAFVLLVLLCVLYHLSIRRIRAALPGDIYEVIERM